MTVASRMRFWSRNIDDGAARSNLPEPSEGTAAAGRPLGAAQTGVGAAPTPRNIVSAVPTSSFRRSTVGGGAACWSLPVGSTPAEGVPIIASPLTVQRPRPWPGGYAATRHRSRAQGTETPTGPSRGHGHEPAGPAVPDHPALG